MGKKPPERVSRGRDIDSCPWLLAAGKINSKRKDRRPVANTHVTITSTGREEYRVRGKVSVTVTQREVTRSVDQTVKAPDGEVALKKVKAGLR